MTTQAQNELIEQFRHARRVSAPLVAITTPDPAATEQLILDSLNQSEKPPPIVSWDLIRGIRAKNEAGHTAVSAQGASFAEKTKNPIEMLTSVTSLPEDSCVFVHMANRLLTEGQYVYIIQAVWNLRDEFKQNGRTLVMLSPQISLPIELQTDVLQLDDPFPDDAQLQQIVREQLDSAKDELEFEPDDECVRSAASQLKGTAAFAAEQLAAMAIRTDRIDTQHLNTHARKIIAQTKGLTFETGTETFNDIGGLDFIKSFGRKLFSGPSKPAVIVRVEELEKTMGGARGDLSGTSADALQVLLSEMEDNNWSGILCYGTPGGGKSAFGKALANTYEAKPLRFDINATKGSLVGSSEAAIRNAMKVIRSIGGENVFFVASVNRIDESVLPPELQRRFRCGVWFFDVPDADERHEIWRLNLLRYGIINQNALDEPDLTGADIRNLCEMARNLNVPLTEARQYVVPLKTQSPQAIDKAREHADGRFISAAHGGVYESSKRKESNKKPARRMSLQGQ